MTSLSFAARSRADIDAFTPASVFPAWPASASRTPSRDCASAPACPRWSTSAMAASIACWSSVPFLLTSSMAAAISPMARFVAET